MTDRFDPAEFDPPAPSPTSTPGDDYRLLLDAMRQAGAEGVAQCTATSQLKGQRHRR